MKGSVKGSSDSIKCPNCGESIPVSETLRHQLTEQTRAELRGELIEEQKTLVAREKELKVREEDLLSSEKTFEQRVKERVVAEKAKLGQQALVTAREEFSTQIRALQEETAEKDQKLKEAQAMELQLRKEKRQVESEKQAIELEVARKIDQERQRIREEASKEFSEEHRLKDAEKEHKLQEALKVNDELRRKLEQGSQQIQGEVLELELEKILSIECPFDEILSVAKGVRGADVLQRVRTRQGRFCGTILWETKHTKNWSDAWLQKLKVDQQEAKADIAVLVSDVLPKDVDGFGSRDAIWITSPRYICGLLLALRQTLIQVSHAKSAAASKDQTIEALFKYVTGPEFQHRVEAIIRVFMNMKEELEEEKRVTQRRWSKREKQLDSLVGNTGGMYGDLQGLLGSSMQPIPSLEPTDNDLSVEGESDIESE